MTALQILGIVVLCAPVWICLWGAYRKGHLKEALQGMAWGLGFSACLGIGSYLILHGK